MLFTAVRSAVSQAVRYRLVPQKTFTEWNGRLLPAEYKQYLQQGCTIRVVVQTLEPPFAQNKPHSEALYICLEQVRESGDLVGKVEDPYRDESEEKSNGLRQGDIVWAREEHINEIPLEGWQPDEYLQAVKHLQPESRRYRFTGLRGVNEAEDEEPWQEEETEEAEHERTT